ncbi:FadR/GntR family transcriptional regulator [Streptomyces sp. SKN60]|uniref:FadR/GntR family transcriptional regulator n=1 Tax=Streptomyces TaxID=1883 RepID=UPI002247F91D|nr:FadR/GntR family transcriptional regulator [Streptomyces sp. SKN60]MCX2180211.1 FadR family transcriptional regulator [Streptomyces sp. SKN60]
MSPRASQTPENEATSRRPAVPQELFKAVSSSRVSQVIVEQIRHLLKEERLQPGDRLPSERELCVQFGCSRVTIREALRILEANGLVEIRVGARGGAFVTAPTSSRVSEGLADLLTFSPLTASQVTEARLIFELGVVPLAVERATDEDIADLRAMCEAHAKAMRQGEYTMELSTAFHIRLAACTHNPAIEMLVESFRGPMLMSLREAQANEPATMGRRGTKEHRELVEAIAARDTEAATKLMRTHLERTASRVKD